MSKKHSTRTDRRKHQQSRRQHRKIMLGAPGDKRERMIDRRTQERRLLGQQKLKCPSGHVHTVNEIDDNGCPECGAKNLTLFGDGSRSEKIVSR